MDIDFGRLSKSEAYHTLIQTVVPRPIAWVLTENENGSHNLAPFSFFNVVSSKPPVLAFSLGPKGEGEPKDTLANIRRQPHFVVHVPHRALAEEVNESGRALAAGESEVEHIGLRLSEMPDFPVPRLSDCRVALACRHFETHHIVGGTQRLVLGEVLHLYLADELAEQDVKGRLRIDTARLEPLARLGGSDYGVLGEIFSIGRTH